MNENFDLKNNNAIVQLGQLYLGTQCLVTFMTLCTLGTFEGPKFT